jgi:hypothetical protein
VAVFAILFAAFVDCSIGPPLPFATLSGWLSPIGLNDVSRAMMWACFPLAMLAAFGEEHLSSGRYRFSCCSRSRPGAGASSRT